MRNKRVQPQRHAKAATFAGGQDDDEQHDDGGLHEISHHLGTPSGEASLLLGPTPPSQPQEKEPFTSDNSDLEGGEENGSLLRGKGPHRQRTVMNRKSEASDEDDDILDIWDAPKTQTRKACGEQQQRDEEGHTGPGAVSASSVRNGRESWAPPDAYPRRKAELSAKGKGFGSSAMLGSGLEELEEGEDYYDEDSDELPIIEVCNRLRPRRSRPRSGAPRASSVLSAAQGPGHADNGDVDVEYHSCDGMDGQQHALATGSPLDALHGAAAGSEVMLQDDAVGTQDEETMMTTSEEEEDGEEHAAARDGGMMRGTGRDKTGRGVAITTTASPGWSSETESPPCIGAEGEAAEVWVVDQTCSGPAAGTKRKRGCEEEEGRPQGAQQQAEAREFAAWLGLDDPSAAARFSLIADLPLPEDSDTYLGPKSKKARVEVSSSESSARLCSSLAQQQQPPAAEEEHAARASDVTSSIGHRPEPPPALASLAPGLTSATADIDMAVDPPAPQQQELEKTIGKDAMVEDDLSRSDSVGATSAAAAGVANPKAGCVVS